MRKYGNKIRKWGSRAILVLLMAALAVTGSFVIRLRNEKNKMQQRLNREISQGIADKIFRFHVIANSDTKKDQNLKLQIKSTVVDYMKEITGANSTFEDNIEQILIHLPEI